LAKHRVSTYHPRKRRREGKVVTLSTSVDGFPAGLAAPAFLSLDIAEILTLGAGGRAVL